MLLQAKKKLKIGLKLKITLVPTRSAPQYTSELVTIISARAPEQGQALAFGVLRTPVPHTALSSWDPARPNNGSEQAAEPFVNTSLLPPYSSRLAMACSYHQLCSVSVITKS